MIRSLPQNRDFCLLPLGFHSQFPEVLLRGDNKEKGQLADRVLLHQVLIRFQLFPQSPSEHMLLGYMFEQSQSVGYTVHLVGNSVGIGKRQNLTFTIGN